MSKTVLMASIVAVCGSVASAQLYSNATNWAMPNAPIGLGTGPTSGSGVAAPAGYQWSEVQSDGAGNANTNAGFGASGGNRLADDFTIPAGQSWNISDIHFFGYVTGSATTANPFTSWTLQIWDAAGPGVGSLLFGDTLTNRMGAVSNTDMFRVFNTTTPPPGSAPGTTRLIRDVTVNVGTILGPGTYWLDWSSSGGFHPALNMPGARTIAGWNGRQFIAAPAPGAWGPALDAGNPSTAVDVAQDFPFIINGVPAPGSIALLGIGGIFAARRRRN